MLSALCYRIKQAASIKEVYHSVTNPGDADERRKLLGSAGGAVTGSLAAALLSRALIPKSSALAKYGPRLAMLAGAGIGGNAGYSALNPTHLDLLRESIMGTKTLGMSGNNFRKVLGGAGGAALGSVGAALLARAAMGAEARILPNLVRMDGAMLGGLAGLHMANHEHTHKGKLRSRFHGL